ncbi:MAG TPA: LysM domain-containing protein [Paenisporosarcina sp.]|nr:LysM domain-containing protein [Paenisporosarcina sp.]
MNNDDYQNKIEEYRKPIQTNGEETKPNTRTSRRSSTPSLKKTKQKRNLLLPILFFFFILIPVSFLIYVFAFYQPNANETTVYDNSEVQYEQNDEDTTTETDGENTESEENTDTETPVEPAEQPVVEETPVEEEPVEEAPVEEQPVEEPIEEPTEAEPANGKTHVVQPGETLYRIAMNYYNSPNAVEQIKAANGLSSNEISSGQTLILP